PVSGYLWDHYTYVPSIGILFIIGRFYQYVAERKFSYSMKAKTPLTVILILFGIMLIAVTWNRNNIWQDSGTLYSEVIRLHPDNEAAYNNRGQYHMKQENYRKAEQDFSQALEARSSYASAYLNRGRARFEQEKYKSALGDLNKAIELNPSEAAYMERGLLKARLGYHQRAIKDFSTVLNRHPQSTQALNNLGLSYGQLEQYNKALEAFNRAISIDPNNAKAYGNRGTVYYKTGNQQKACSDWSRSANLGNKRARQILQQYCR
ncbi:MAG: tetratricopeptide repeat protein, partial [Bacteroidales bacterium]|nr:tetratricopeptide repeat protein [Bacteroidales bacterium]